MGRPLPVGTSAGNVNFNLITNQAAQAYWYGEVFDNTPGTWTTTDMTIGQFASSTNQFGKVGYFRNMLVRKKSDGNWYFTNTANMVASGGDDLNCYNHWLTDFTGDPNWRTTMFFGGPGGGGSCDPF